MFGLILAISIFTSASFAAALPEPAPLASTSLLNVTELVAACVPPSIRVTVASSSSSSQFSVPLFTDCTYQTSNPLTPGQNSSPASAISSSADYSQYVDSTGAALDSYSVSQFLEFFGNTVTIDDLLSSTACAITDTSNNVDTIQETTQNLDNGSAIKVLNYQCVAEL